MALAIEPLEKPVTREAIGQMVSAAGVIGSQGIPGLGLVKTIEIIRIKTTLQMSQDHIGITFKSARRIFCDGADFNPFSPGTPLATMSLFRIEQASQIIVRATERTLHKCQSLPEMRPELDTLVREELLRSEFDHQLGIYEADCIQYPGLAAEGPGWISPQFDPRPSHDGLEPPILTIVK